MGGLNTSISIGLQALEASQGALNATSNNIANVNTPGYTREVAQLSANPASLSADGETGGGVNLDGLQSVRDELLNAQIQQQTSLQSAANTESSSLQQIQSAFAVTGVDLSSTFATLSTNLAQLSANPTSPAAQQGVLSAGQTLARSFNTTASALTGAQTDADQTVSQTVGQINALTTQIAALNGKVAQLQATGQDGGTVQDQRDQLVQKLAGLTGISIAQSSTGEVITTGNGTPLVLGGQSVALQTATGSGGFQQVLDANGNNVTATIQGGQLGGAIQIRDQTIPGFLTQLNTLARQFATSFNAAQAKGFDSNGNVGQNFFTIPANPAAAASGLSVALTSPAQVAISSDGSAGSNGNIANLTGVLTGALPSGATPATAYSNLVFQVGNAASNATTQSTAVGQNLTQLQNLQGSISSVNIDEETTNLLRFQTAYEAASRIVSTVQVLQRAALNMGSTGSF